MTELINWFRGNLLTLNYDKMHFLQFLTKKQNEIKLQITDSNTIITSVNSTKFLGLVIDSALSWRDQIIEVTSKLNKACYAIRILKPLISQNMLRMIYFSYVHSVMSYGIIFWGNSHHSINMFKSQKRIKQIMTDTAKHDTCRPLFKKLQILPFPAQYIFSLFTFVVNNRHSCLSNSAVHDIHTRHNNDLHLPSVGLSLVQKGVLYSGCKIYNHLPSNIKYLSNNVTLFKFTLKKFLIQYLFYSLDEYYQLPSE